MKTLIFFVCLLTICLFPQEKIKKSLLQLPDKTTYKLDGTNSSLPVWVTASETTAYSVHIDIANIISSEGVQKRINYKVEPESTNISVSKTGKLFMIRFDSSEIASLDSGSYSAISIIEGKNTEPLKTALSFEIAPAKNFFSWLEDSLNWILNHFFTFFWNLLQAILLIFVFIFIFKLIYSIFKINRKNSLNVLQIANETGEEGEYNGAAEGIDDILIFKLQEISKLSSRELLEKNRISSTGRSDINTENVQILNVVGGEFSMDLQKIGDVSIGPVKIPIGSISSLILKLVGGNYISGALQKYGNNCKLYIRLDRKPSALSLRRKRKHILPVKYFEASWKSDNSDDKKLTEKIPSAVENLAYKLILELSRDIETRDWVAYKYFLDGYKLFSDFEKNKTRIDLLRDAISLWRQSIKSDPDFAQAHYNLGVAYDMDERFQDAIFHYQKAILLKPKSIGAEAHFNLARIFFRKYRDDNRTLSELEKARKIDHEIPDIYNLEGLVYSNQPNNYSKESELYQKAIDFSQKNPNPIFYYNLCVAKSYLNMLEEAQTAGEKSYNLFGDREKLTNLLLTMGLIHFQKGINFEKNDKNDFARSEFEKSAKYLSEGLLKEPENKDLLQKYRDVLFKLDRIKDCNETLKRLIRLYPKEPVCYTGISEYLRSAKVNDNEINIYEQIGKILQDEQDPLKLSEKLQKENVSLIQSKLFKGILASIFYKQYDPKKYPQFRSKSATTFEEIFQPPFNKEITALEPELLYCYGMVLFQLGNYEESIAKINQAISIYNLNEQVFELAQAYSNLAKGYMKLAENQYIEWFGSALIEKNQETQMDETSNNTDKLYNKVFESMSQADLAFQNASYFYKKGGFLDLAVSAHLDNAEFLIKRESYTIHGEIVYDSAKQECNKAIQINHKDFRTYTVKGSTYYSSRQYSKAIPEYEKSIELNFNLKNTHYNIGLCYFHMGDYGNASNAFKTVIKLDQKYTNPDDMTSPDAYQRLAMSLEELGNIDEAVKVLTEATDIHPIKVKYRILLGQLFKRKNDLAKAAEHFRYALRLDQDNIQKMKHIVYTELADMYAENYTNISTAKKYINFAKYLIKNLNPAENEKIMSMIENTEGWIYYNQNKYDLSIDLLEKTLINFLHDPKYHSRLAFAYQKYAESFSDEKLKKEYIDKSLLQWKIIANLKGDGFYKKEAEENITKLTKT